MDLPAPEGPTRPRVRPAGRWNETPSRAGRGRGGIAPGGASPPRRRSARPRSGCPAPAGRPRGCRRAAGGVDHVRLVVQEGEHAHGRGHRQQALVVELVQLAQGAEDLDAQEEHDHQGGDAQLALADPHRAPAQDDGGAEGHAQGGHAPGGDVHRQHLHRGPVEAAGLLRQQVAPPPALAEDLERGQPLDGVHELGGEDGVGAAAGPCCPWPSRAGRRSGASRVSRAKMRKIRAEGRSRKAMKTKMPIGATLATKSCGQVLPVVGVQLLDGVHRVEQHLAGALLVQVGRAEGRAGGRRPGPAA